MDLKQPKIKLEDVYNYLQRFSLSDSLLVIAVVNSVFKYGYKKAQQNAVPQGTLRWIEENFSGDKGAFSLTLRMTQLARFLLLSGSNDYKKLVLDTGTKEMAHALFLLGNFSDPAMEGGIKDIKDVDLIFARMAQQQFPLQSNRKDVIGRGYLLFEEIPKKINTGYNFDRKLAEYYGLSPMSFIASGLAQWIMSSGIVKYKLTIEVEPLKSFVTTETLEKFLQLSSGTPEDYRRQIRGDDWQTPHGLKDVHYFDPFIKMPAIKIGFSLKLNKGSYIVPQPFYLLQRASLGTFYLLADKEKELALSDNKSGRNNFRESFGLVYREYVGRHLALADQQTKFLDLDKELPDVGFPKPDFALIKDGACILFEVKTALLSLDSRTLFDPAEIEGEVVDGNFKKAMKQLDGFESAARDGSLKDQRFTSVKNFVKVIVGFEDVFLANTIILPIMREKYGKSAENVQIMTLFDIEIIGTRLDSHQNIVAAIYEKAFNRDTYKWPMNSFISSKMPPPARQNPLLEKAFADFMTVISGKDYRKIEV